MNKLYLTEAQERLSLQLFDIGAIQFGEYKLKLHDRHPEAPLSPIYIDLRLLRRFPVAKKAAIDVYQELIRPLRFDLLADIPTAATPLVSSLSDRLGIGMITLRTDTKIHGISSKVDGLLDYDKGKTVVLIDDLITNADSKLETINILKGQGVKVNDVVVLIDIPLVNEFAKITLDFVFQICSHSIYERFSVRRKNRNIERSSLFL